MSFKELQNNRRFLKVIQKVKNEIELGKKINFSLIAVECHYYDQAHFIKEFKRFMGITPFEYIRSFNDKKDNYILTLQSFNSLVKLFNKDSIKKL